MQDEHPAIGRSPQAEELRQVARVFEPFGSDGYAFVPFQHPFLELVMRNVWIVFLVLIIFLVAIALYGLFSLTNPQLAIEIMLEGEPRRFIHHDTNPLGAAMYRIGADYYIIGCSAAALPAEPGLWMLTFPNGIELNFRSEGDLQCLSSQMGSAIHTLSNLRVYVLPFLLFFLLASIVYTNFIRSAPQSLYQTAMAGRLLPNLEYSIKSRWIQPENWHTYVSELQAALNGRWRNYFLLLLAILVIVIDGLMFVYRNSSAIISSGYLASALFEIVIMIVTPLTLTVLMGGALWVILVVALYLRWISPTYNLVIQPDHPDTCGGLKRLGDICLIMALISLIPGAIIILWMATGALVGVDTLSILAVVSWSIIMASAFTTFFLPVMRIHNELGRVKEHYTEEVNANLAPVKNRLRELVSIGEGGSPEAQTLYKELEMLNTLYPPDLTFHTWPFDTRGYTTFVIGVLIPILIAFLAH